MATLQKIRNRGPLLLIVIGLALLAFILGDAWKMINPNQGVVMAGSIDGKSISAIDFQDEFERYSEVVKFSMGVSSLSDEQIASVKDEVWSTMVRRQLLQKETDALGLVVTDAEVQSIIEKGTDPVLANTPFSNEKTGAFDVDYLTSFLAGYKQLDRESVSQEYITYYDNLYNFWLFVEDNIKSSLLYAKYVSLVEGGIISNPISQKNSYENRIKRSDIVLSAIPYLAVPDSSVTVTSSDIKKIYEEKKELFYQMNESREVVYIDYEVKPSQSDRDDLLKEVTDYSNQLKETSDDYASFVRLTESSVSYSEVPRTSASIPSDVLARIDSVKMGEVYGPYYNSSDDSYNAFKILSSIESFDSIQFSQIQIVGLNANEVAGRADSIYKAIKDGAVFEEIAAKYSQNGAPQWLSSADYEAGSYSGDNAKFLNALNKMKKGELSNLSVENGNLIIKVVDVKKPVKKYLAAIVKRVSTFSSETNNQAYNKLSQFVANNNSVDSLVANAEKNGFRLLSIPDLQSFNNLIGGVAKSHDALRWAFEASSGNVSKIFEVGSENDHLLVVGVSAIHKKGYRTLAEMTPNLKSLALNKKKAELLKQRFANVKSFQEAKSVDGASFDTVQFVNFTTPPFISITYTNEPAIGASVYNLKRETLSAPIEGEGGVFVAMKISPDEHSVDYDQKTEKARVNAIENRVIADQLLQELYFDANVEDFRYKTF